MVVTEQTTESFVATDRLVRIGGYVSRFKELIAEPLVTTLRMIVIDKRPYGSPQRRFGEEDHAGEAFAFYRKYETFGIGVQIWRPCRKTDDVGAGVLEEAPKLRGELAVAVEQEISLLEKKWEPARVFGKRAGARSRGPQRRR